MMELVMVLWEHAIDDKLRTHRSAATRPARVRTPRGRCVYRRLFGSILTRAPLLWPRIVYDPRMRLYDSEFPVVENVTAALAAAR